MLHHIELYVSSLQVSQCFWTPLLAKIGYVQTAQWDEGFTLENKHDAYLTFVQVRDKYEDNSYHRCAVGLNHLAFQVEDKEAVEELRLYCVDQKINCLYDDAYPFANGGEHYYALYIEDPDRIKVEFVAA